MKNLEKITAIAETFFGPDVVIRITSATRVEDVPASIDQLDDGSLHVNYAWVTQVPLVEFIGELLALKQNRKEPGHFHGGNLAQSINMFTQENLPIIIHDQIETVMSQVNLNGDVVPLIKDAIRAVITYVTVYALTHVHADVCGGRKERFMPLNFSANRIRITPQHLGGFRDSERFADVGVDSLGFDHVDHEFRGWIAEADDDVLVPKERFIQAMAEICDMTDELHGRFHRHVETPDVQQNWPDRVAMANNLFLATVGHMTYQFERVLARVYAQSIAATNPMLGKDQSVRMSRLRAALDEQAKYSTIESRRAPFNEALEGIEKGLELDSAIRSAVNTLVVCMYDDFHDPIVGDKHEGQRKKQKPGDRDS